MQFAKAVGVATGYFKSREFLYKARIRESIVFDMCVENPNKTSAMYEGEAGSFHVSARV